ncbi:MAG: nucleotide sugar dehydrogenase [Firmicutes bacterium]|nr:nucleotide sugar dehydrogenase [Bacillota bacterium]
MINVIGMGYIGLPTALMISSSKVDHVIGTDIDNKKINNLNNKYLTFEENELSVVFDKAIENGMEFSTEYADAEFYIISVPTPYSAKSKKIDPKFIITAVEEIIKISTQEATIVIESTIPPGTIDNYIRPIIKKAKKENCLHLVHAPERIIPGNMIYELRNNDRTIGADSKIIGEKVKRIYGSFCNGEITVTDIRTAEMSKVVENTYRDINIAFANELAKICREGGLDVYKIIDIANRHPRVNILKPGPGVGGHCISVDPWFLVGDYPDTADLIYTARKINDSMPLYVFNRLKDIMRSEGIHSFEKVGFYGITYKENVDDIRESPMLQLIDKLNENDDMAVNQFKLYDPMLNYKIVENQEMEFNTFIDSVDVIVVMTAHDHLLMNKELLAGKIIYDTRNAINDAKYTI